MSGWASINNPNCIPLGTNRIRNGPQITPPRPYPSFYLSQQSQPANESNVAERQSYDRPTGRITSAGPSSTQSYTSPSCPGSIGSLPSLHMPVAIPGPISPSPRRTSFTRRKSSVCIPETPERRSDRHTRSSQPTSNEFIAKVTSPELRASPTSPSHQLREERSRKDRSERRTGPIREVKILPSIEKTPVKGKSHKRTNLPSTVDDNQIYGDRSQGSPQSLAKQNSLETNPGHNGTSSTNADLQEPTMTRITAVGKTDSSSILDTYVKKELEPGRLSDIIARKASASPSFEVPPKLKGLGRLDPRVKAFKQQLKSKLRKLKLEEKGFAEMSELDYSAETHAAFSHRVSLCEQELKYWRSFFKSVFRQADEEKNHGTILKLASILHDNQACYTPDGSGQTPASDISNSQRVENAVPPASEAKAKELYPGQKHSESSDYFPLNEKSEREEAAHLDPGTFHNNIVFRPSSSATTNVVTGTTPEPGKSKVKCEKRRLTSPKNTPTSSRVQGSRAVSDNRSRSVVSASRGSDTACSGMSAQFGGSDEGSKSGTAGMAGDLALRVFVSGVVEENEGNAGDNRREPVRSTTAPGKQATNRQSNFEIHVPPVASEFRRSAAGVTDKQICQITSNSASPAAKFSESADQIHASPPPEAWSQCAARPLDTVATVALKRREVDNPDSRCRCQLLPSFFTENPWKLPSLGDWQGCSEEFFAHILQIKECPGHTGAVHRHCKHLWFSRGKGYLVSNIYE